jgi:site-specific recombinase XerD
MNDKKMAFYKTVRDFLTDYLPMQKAYSPCTIKSYKETLSLLVKFIRDSNGVALEKINFARITRCNVEAFLSWLETERGCGVSTRNQRLAGVRSFVGYAAGRSVDVVSCLNEIKEIPLKKNAKPPMLKYFSESALTSILNAPNANTKIGLRDLVFMALLYDTGARNQELLDLTVGDLRLSRAAPEAVVTGKGGKTRIVPLMPNTVGLCIKYLKTRRIDADYGSLVFFTERLGSKTPMSPDNTERFIKKYGAIARQTNSEVPDNLHPHMFRHARSVHLYRSGMPLPLVSEWLGHADIATTQIFYASADVEMKRKAILKGTGDFGELFQDQEDKAVWEGNDEIILRLYGLE